MGPLLALNRAALPAAFPLLFEEFPDILPAPPQVACTHVAEGVAPPILKGENGYVAAPN
jgi:hypothetical protein